MRYRQVHLDFHTSEKIKDIGVKFSKKQFQQMLKKGHVDSITVFSKCHHGWAYHPSKANKMHPELKFDLLAAQIEAAHEIGVKTPVYISAGYDQKAANEHPEWLHWSKKNYDEGGVFFEKPRYYHLCLNTPYLEKLLSQVKEVCENYDADGIFLDIVSVLPCYCPTCLKAMADRGLDKDNPEDVLLLAEETYANYTRRVRQTIDSVKPGLPVFHNGGHIRHGRRDLAFMNTHLELESLPTGNWGYDHFPLSAAYVRTIGMDYLGMTGKFHKSWGEFGGYKHPNALKYEVALSAVNGAKCSIGDQLAPDGTMDNATYTLIGEAYKTLEERQKWLENYKNISDIAILSNEAIYNYCGDITLDETEMKNSNAGCSRILLESRYLFDVIDTDADFSKYKLIILPDFGFTDKMLSDRLNEYVENGGKLLASYKSAMNMTDTFGIEYEGMSEYNPTYLRPSFEIDSLENAAYLIYSDCTKVKATTGESVAITESPYFNRTWEHFCSHHHAPSSGEKYADAIVMTENTAYISHKLFGEYFENGNIYTKEIIRKIIAKLLGDRISVKAALPAQAVLTLTANGDSEIVHTLYASPVKRGINTEVIEDIIPLYDISVSVKSEKTPKSVKLVPQNQPLEFEYKNGRIEFNIPKIECWQMTEIQF